MSKNISFSKARMDAMRDYARGTKKMDAATVPAWTFANLDSSDTLYLAQQLEEIRAGLYEIQYGKLKAQRLVPWNTSFSPGTEQYTVRNIDVTGMPAPMKGRESALPTVRHTTKSAVINFHSFGLGYDYSVQEARAARQAGLPLEARLAATCHERQMRNLDSLALIGDASKVTDIGGLFNASGTLSVTTPTDGTGSGTTFGSKNPDQIIRDLNAPMNKIITTTFEIEGPDTLVLPVTTETDLSYIRVGDGTSATIMQFFKSNRPEITVERSMYLESNGAWTGKRMITYQNDPTRLEMLVSIMFDQSAPQVDGYVIKTMTETRTAGIALYLPESVCVQDNV
jgi:hypothetical protein